MAKLNFKNIGLRRDKNLSDVTNRNLALSNLLNDFVAAEPDLSYNADDLFSAIDRIHTNNLSLTDLSKIRNLTVNDTVELDNGEIVTEPATPLITLKNQIDRIEGDTKNPSYFTGGDGLTAKFWNSEDINNYIYSENNANAPEAGDDIVVDFNNFQDEKIFWDSGDFLFTEKLSDKLSDGAGLVQWSGYFMFDATQEVYINIDSTGYFMFEIADKTGNLTVVKNIYTAQRSFTPVTNVSNSDTIEIDFTDSKYIVVGDKLIDFINPATNSPYNVISVADTSFKVDGIISSMTAGQAQKVDISDFIGKDSWSETVVLSDIVEYEPRQIRISFWFPQNVDFSQKTLNINIQTRNNFRYTYLYSVLPDYDTSENFSLIKQFYQNRLLKGGGAVGADDSYKSVYSINSVLIDYEPPLTLSLLNKSCTAISQTSLLRTNDTDDISIGNFVIGNGVEKYSKVIEIKPFDVIRLDKNLTTDTAETRKFVDHKGLVDYFLASSTNSTVTLSSDTVNRLRPGMTVLTESSTNSEYIRISSVDFDNNTFETTSPINANSEYVYVYYDSGLQNQITYQLLTEAVAGDNEITLIDSIGIEPGYIIESKESNAIPTGTTVDSITGNTLTLSNVLLSNIPSNELVYSIRANVDTAPPFKSTDNGLTTDTEAGARDLSINNGEITMSRLSSDNVTTSTTTDNLYNREIPIFLNGVEYKILGSST